MQSHGIDNLNFLPGFVYKWNKTIFNKNGDLVEEYIIEEYLIKLSSLIKGIKFS